MKVYPDANVYLRLLLGEGRGGDDANAFFKRSADCLFSLVVSQTAFVEVDARCAGRGVLWLQDHIDKFKGAGKLAIVAKTREEDLQAARLDAETGGEFGKNDFLHALLAGRYADVFVTEDLRFKKTASRIVRTMSLREFLDFART